MGSAPEAFLRRDLALSFSEVNGKDVYECGRSSLKGEARIPVYPYVVFYRIALGNVPQVLRVIDGRRDLGTALLPD
jgi:hypothetical protein